MQKAPSISEVRLYLVSSSLVFGMRKLQSFEISSE